MASSNNVAAPADQQVVGETTTCCMIRLWSELDEMLDAARNVRRLRETVGQLAAMRSRVHGAIVADTDNASPDSEDDDSAARLRRLGCTEEVGNWLARTRKAEQQANSVVADYAALSLPRLRLVSRHRIGKRAVRALWQEQQIVQERDGICVVRRGGGSFTATAHQVVPTPSAVVAMEAYVDEALRYIADESVGVIGVCGMGGVGKTTLLRAINNSFLPTRQSPVSGRKFDHVIWAVASKECSIERLQNDVASKLGLALAGLPDEHSSADLEERAMPIAEYLRNTSFLMLLDDLWECFDLKLIGVPYPDGAGDEQSNQRRTVVLTTRSEIVCSKMKADRIVNVECLKSDDAWTLFELNATAVTIASHAEIARLAREAARECRGLPLALITIVKSMSTKADPELWRHAIDKLREANLHEITGMEEENTGMLRVLKVSYDYLPTPTMQECFLTCCLWPEDYSIKKEKLVECWLGLGLIAGAAGIDEDVETGTRIITALKDVRLLECGSDGDPEDIRMHDMIRDMSLWIASECGAKRNKWLVRAGVGIKTASKLNEQWRMSPAGATERVSLMNNFIEELPPRLPARPGLKALMLQMNTSLNAIPGSFLRCVPALTYLDLSDTIIRVLPGEIGSLVCLRYLNVSGTYISALPPDLLHLTQLEHLLLSDTNMLENMPRSVILGLQKLKILDVFASKYTRWRLSDNDDDDHGAEASLEELESRNACLKFLGINVSSVAALQKLSGFANVSTRRLCLKDMAGPALLRLFPSTLSDVLGGLDMLETLQQFTLRGCTGVQDIVLDGGRSDDEHRRAYRMPKLEKLDLLRLIQVETIQFRQITASHVFPALRWLNILNCYVLKNANWALHLPLLECLQLHYCHKMEAIVDGCDGPAVEQGSPTFPCLKTLSVHGMQSLGCLCRNVAVSFPALEVLEVDQCNVLRRLDGVRPQGKLREIQGSDEWRQRLEWEEDGIRDALFPYFKHHS